jgi:hypothetical protein
MKTTRNILLALSLLGSAAGVASAQTSISAGIHVGSSGGVAVDLGFFYDDLASYGNWIERPSYGWVWTPSQVSTSWRPYQDGHWVWTDQGWTWISEEPYGWATYHYGRWYEDPEIGWSWVPGDEWAPAWVDWQAGDDYVGWAPLPPAYDINAGYRSGGYGLGPEAYVFVPEQNFLAVSISAYIVPQVRVTTFFGRTRNYTQYRNNGGRIYNQGLPIDQIQRRVGRTVTRYQISDLGADGYRQRGARIQGNQIQIFRPQVQRTVRVAPPASRPNARRAVVSAEQFRNNHPNRATRRQVQGQAPAQVQGQNDRQRSSTGRQQGGRIQPPQAKPQVERQRPPQVQPQQQRRPAQVQPQTKPQVRPQPGRQVQPQNERQPRVQPQNDRQRQPQVEPQRQVKPQQQPQVQAKEKDKGNQKGKAKQRDRNQNQDDDRRPPVR